MNVRPHVVPRPEGQRNRRLSFRGARMDAVLLTALLLPFLPPATFHADADVFSPTVSYQYADGVTFSPAISYQYHEGMVFSPVVSYQYLESLDTDILGFLSSPRVSYYYQFQVGGGSQPIVISGRVTGTGGVGLSGAQVTASVQLLTVAQATTDANGDYSLPGLFPGTYALKVTRTSYANAARVLTLDASTATQNFQLNALPAAPTMQQTTREPPSTFTQPPVGPMGSTLKVFDGTSFTNITQQNAPSTNLLTIVLTHGWNSNPTLWATNMAARLRANGITTNLANIVAWDWRTAAAGILPTEERTPSQGVALGTNLLVVLGSNYSQPIHFLGHSLGTIVNAAAANYLHGDRTAQQAVSPSPWPPMNTHMTLFDQAEFASLTDARAMFDGLTVGSVNTTAGVIVYGAEVLQRWKPSTPLRSKWSDNYISYFGFYLPNTFNIALQKAAGFFGLNVIAAHSYPMNWYSDSIARPTVTSLGIQQSHEYGLKVGLPSSAFPSGLFRLGGAYHQDPLASDQLVLEPLPPDNIYQLIVPFFGTKADAVVQTTIAAGEAVGNVAATVWDSAQAAGQAVAQGFEYAGNVAAQAGQTLINSFDLPVLRLNLRTGPASLLPQGPGNLLQTLNVSGASSSSNTAAMVWLPILIPSNETAMAFDFIVAGDPVDDVMVCGIGTNNLFSLEAKYIPTNSVSASRLIAVTAWAGTTNELFFGLMGGTSTNAELQIDNIRFYSVGKHPRGDVNGDVRVTGADSLLINQVLVGLRSATSSVFQTTTFLNGDVNSSGGVTGADSLLINQTLVGLRPYVVTEILPGSHSSNQTTSVIIYGIGFPTNQVPSVSIGAPVGLTLSNVVVVSKEQLSALVPAGGGLGTGTVNVIYATTNGVISFGRFINQ
jgi:pimeloyl-ACP methyl ester carboxylesterase